MRSLPHVASDKEKAPRCGGASKGGGMSVTHTGLQIAATGAITVMVGFAAVRWIGRCPKPLLAVPILTAYFAGWAAIVGGMLWWIWE
jgi:hypothetical protein